MQQHHDRTYQISRYIKFQFYFYVRFDATNNCHIVESIVKYDPYVRHVVDDMNAK